jgi:hypothetical protein
MRIPHEGILVEASVLQELGFNCCRCCLCYFSPSFRLRQIVNMVDVIVLSDDENDEKVLSLQPQGKDKINISTGPLQIHGLKRKALRKLVLVDSRRCHRMPRPRFLPITSSLEVAISDPNIKVPFPEPSDRHAPRLDETPRSAAEMDDEEIDPDYKDEPPPKRRRTGTKRVPKKHGKLAPPDWEVIRGAPRASSEAGVRSSMLPTSVLDRKEASDYVKKLTANLDWEGIVRHLAKLRLDDAKSGPGDRDLADSGSKSRKKPDAAARLKRYWQTILTKGILKMDDD